MESELIKESDPNNKILFFGFNQDASLFTIGTEYGFHIYNSCPFKDLISRST
jgi:hypothetical protein